MGKLTVSGRSNQSLDHASDHSSEDDIDGHRSVFIPCLPLHG